MKLVIISQWSGYNFPQDKNISKFNWNVTVLRIIPLPIDKVFD